MIVEALGGRWDGAVIKMQDNCRVLKVVATVDDDAIVPTTAFENVRRIVEYPIERHPSRPDRKAILCPIYWPDIL